jgi:hypothetical protein
MLVKKIKDPVELYVGQKIMRVVCNLYSETWVEVHDVTKSVYSKKIDGFADEMRMFQTFTGHYLKPRDEFATSFGFDCNPVIKQVACFEYDEEFYNTLEKCKDNRFEFLEYINERKLTDQEMLRLMYDWSFQFWQSKMSKHYMSGVTYLTQPPFLTDESLKHLSENFQRF